VFNDSGVTASAMGEDRIGMIENDAKRMTAVLTLHNFHRLQVTARFISKPSGHQSRRAVSASLLPLV